MSTEADFPVSRCSVCDRDVLTHLHFDDDGGEHRLCFHCDAELDPEALRWVPETALAALGYGLTTATISWLSWQGYAFPLLGIPVDSDLAGTDLGVLVALALGLLLPIVAGIPAIRKQEAARAPE